MQTKFKKGDRVRAVVNCSFGGFVKGAKGIVHSVYYDGDLYVKFDGDDIKRVVCKEEVKLIRRLATYLPESTRPASEMTLREQMIKDIYCSLLISEQLTGINHICTHLNITTEGYKWAIHFPAYIRKIATEQADALIQSLNEKQ